MGATEEAGAWMRRTWSLAKGIVLNCCLLSATALIMLLHTVFVLPAKLCMPAYERRMQEALQSVWVLMLLGTMGACADSEIVVTIDDDEDGQRRGYETFRRLAAGYRFDGATGGAYAARLAEESHLNNKPMATSFSTPPISKADRIDGPEAVVAPNQGTTSPRMRPQTRPDVEGESDSIDSATLEEYSRESDLIMANHQAYLDWAYIWAMMTPLGREGAMKIILKESIAHIPVYGWGVRLVNFVLLARNWDVDRANIGRRLRRLPCPDVPFSLLIFPEGTTLCRRGQEATQRYAARSNGRHGVPRFTLLPRVTGTQFALQQLGAHLDGVLDVTVGYTGIGRLDSQNNVAEFRMPEDTYGPRSVFVEGRGPRAVHIHARYYPLSEVPFLPEGAADLTSRVPDVGPSASRVPSVEDVASQSEGSVPTVDSSNSSLGSRRTSQSHGTVPSCPSPDPNTFATTAAFEDWMYARFREKELLMEAFYRDGRFPGVSSAVPTIAPPGALVGLVLAGVLAAVFFYALFSLLYLIVLSLL